MRGARARKAARKNLPRKEARIQRAYRQAVTIEFPKGDGADAGAVRRATFRKVARTDSTRIIWRSRRLTWMSSRRTLGDQPRHVCGARSGAGARRRDDKAHEWVVTAMRAFTS